MSTPLTASSDATLHAPRRASASVPNWLREPLLHFIVLGALLFGIEHVVSARQGNAHTIVIDATVDADARRTFLAARGRDPNATELAALRQVWLDNEVLYREGLALEVDKGDSAIRDRVIFKALSLIDAGIQLPPLDDASLGAWFEQHRAKYDEPARLSFQEAVLSGENSEAAVRALVAALNGGVPGDLNAGLRVFKDRPLSNLEQGYGAEFARQLGEGAIGEWRALKGKDGWRAVVLDARTDAKPASFESLRGVALMDWKDETASALRTQQVRTMARKYQVRIAADQK
jgi:hypothetical protein